MTQGRTPAQPSGGSVSTATSAAALRLVAPRSRAEQLASALDERIREQGLVAGDSVGTLSSLREETGLARATVSEAVRLLRERGVLDIRPGRSGGLFVAEAGPVVRVRHTLLTVQERPDDVMDAIELRDHLEELVDVGAARCHTSEDVVELEVLLGAMQEASDWDGFMKANWALHERIAAASPNAMARAVYVGTLGHLVTKPSRSDLGDEDDYRAERLRVHRELVEAIASRDVDAVRRAVARHNASH